MIPPDYSVILERGDRARTLLGSTAFLEFVDDLTSQHLAQLVASPPGERGREARDYAHLMQFALTELVATVKGHHDTAEQLKLALEQGDDEE